MWQLFNESFSTAGLIPHGFCLQWNPLLLWSLIASDSIIAVSYFSIPFAIWYFAKKRPDISHRPLFLLFGLFIIACGITHFLDVLMIWQPNYWVNAAAKILTAALSLGTVVALWQIMPIALCAPSAQDLEYAKRELEKANAELEHRVQERTLDFENANTSLKSALIQANRFREALNHISTSIYMKDSQHRYVYANQHTLELFKCSAEELSGSDDSHFFPPDAAAWLFAEDVQVLEHGENVAQEFEVLSADGARRIYWNIKTPIYDDVEQTRIEGLCCISTDITERKKIEESLQLAAMVYRTTDQGIIVTDADGDVIAVNPSFTRITGYEPDEIIGKNPNILSSGRQEKSFYQSMWESLNSSNQWQGEIWNRRRDGEIYVELLTINNINNEDGSVYRRIGIFTDISDRKNYEELIWQQANFDELTSLPNRRMVYNRLELNIKKAHRDGKPVALMFIDLDYFKVVNDTLGHAEGDVLLKEAAKRMVSCVRETDTVGRQGGDEFMIVMNELDDILSVERVACSVLAKLAEPYQLSEEQTFISASIGITLYPYDATDVANLFKFADQAMYAAKRQGRNRFSYYTPAMQDAANIRMRLINDLHKALPEEQLLVYYQPIVDLTTDAIYKGEALVRWQHPIHGLISPADFIPLAEETGLIIDIGGWVFRQAATQVAHCCANYHPDFQISVNMSSVQFKRNPNHHTSWVIDHLKMLNLPGHSVVIEITESILMEADEEEEISSQLLAFRDYGLAVALDDFGTGYSSLSYLKRFDIDYIKIDQSFVRNLGPDSSDFALCEAMIVMAHKLGIKVIAEGIETEEQRDLLKQIGCDYGQGYLWSKPVPAEEFEKLLSKARVPSVERLCGYL